VTTGQMIVVIGATALLSSLTTLGLAYALMLRGLRTRIKAEADAYIEAKLKDAGDALQAQVRQGVVDGFQSLPKRGVSSISKGALSAGSTLIDKGLSAFLVDEDPEDS